MFLFPLDAASDVARSNADMQLSIFLALSKSMLDTSSSLGRLQMQSGAKMMDGLASVFNDAIRTDIADAAQSFVPASSTQSANANSVSQSIPHIVSPEPANPRSQTSVANAMEQSSSANDGDAKAAKHAGSSHEHEVDPQPSALLEKLVASVAPDTDILDK